MNIKKDIKVLIADVEPNELQSLGTLMKKEGFSVLLANDGEEAMDIVKREHPMIVLLDIIIPKVDGYEICKSIKKDRSLKDIKVVFLSEKRKQADFEKGYNFGADLCISKPYSPKDLTRKINMMATGLM